MFLNTDSSTEDARMASQPTAGNARNPRGGITRKPWVLSALATAFCAVCCGPARAEAPLQAYGAFTVATDSMFRGVSQTMSSAALVAEATIEHDNGWYANLWGSNVDYVDAGDPDDGANWELDLMLGHSRALSDRLSVDLAWVRYLYPGTAPGVAYDYDEWLASISMDESHALTVGWSSDVFGSGQHGTYYALSSGIALPGDHWLGLLAGHYALDRAYGGAYQHAEVSVSGTVAAMHWQASYHLTGNDARAIFMPSTVRSRLVFSVGTRFN